MEFIIKEIKKEFAKFLVFGISSDSPLFLLQEIKEQVKPSKGDIIIFDQLLQTGDTDNRFLALTFDENDFDLSSAKHIDSNLVDKETKSIVAEFLRKNTLLLKYSILLAQQKEIILQGGFV